MCAALVAPWPAFALSCMPHSVEAAFQGAKISDAEYIVVRGTLRFDHKLLPKTDWEHQQDTPPMTRIPVTLQGLSLSRAGFDVPFDRKVTLEVACLGPWCASANNGDVLAFVARGLSGYVLETNPCGGFLFGNPSPAMLKKVSACFQGKDCTPPKR
ncbi:hypothetical protein C1J03_21235 [Sulfitobacter sp. SK012]|nr:hypothetical protein C1J03_21235 [Sulfitobacter sp. SK012]